MEISTLGFSEVQVSLLFKREQRDYMQSFQNLLLIDPLIRVVYFPGGKSIAAMDLPPGKYTTGKFDNQGRRASLFPHFFH